MAIYSIVQQGDKILRKTCKPVPRVNDNVRKILRNMLETMYDANGVGLAAPQVGILKRMVVVDVGETGPGPLQLVNPEILERSGVQEGSEGCLSCPGVFGDVRRSKYVKVRALNPEGEEIVVEAEGYLARALQHEIDHLDGILFLDKATNVEYERE